MTAFLGAAAAGSFLGLPLRFGAGAITSSTDGVFASSGDYYSTIGASGSSGASSVSSTTTGSS